MQTPNWMRNLPRMPADVDILLVRKQGEKGYIADFRVRRRAVQDWLQFLKQNNPSYWDIELDEEALNTLPEDGTVGHLLLSVTDDEYFASTEDGVPGSGVQPAAAEENDQEAAHESGEHEPAATTPSDSGVITLDPTAHERQAVAATLERLRKGTPMADPAKPTEAVSAGAFDRSCFLKVKAS